MTQSEIKTTYMAINLLKNILHRETLTIDDMNYLGGTIRVLEMIVRRWETTNGE